MERKAPSTGMRTGGWLAAAAVALTACAAGSSGSDHRPAASRPAASSSAAALATPVTAPASANATPTPPPVLPTRPGPGKTFYISVGDSYAAGWQPTSGATFGGTSTNGFAYQLAARATIHGEGLQLVNFGCGGATTDSLLHTQGCLAFLLGPGAAPYPGRTQSQAALRFITAHRGEVGLVTVEIGANDITHCAKAKDLLGCLHTSMAAAGANLRRFLLALRAAAGPAVPIVGLTYPDVLLGRDVLSAPPSRRDASRSVTGFKEIINPTLKAAYADVGAAFVDVTQASGAYLPLTRTTEVASLGTVPLTVAMICELTFYCDLDDIHPRTSGYALMAELVEQVLPKG